MLAKHKGLDREFNTAIRHIVAHRFPRGYTVSPDAPNTYDDLAKVVRKGHMIVSDYVPGDVHDCFETVKDYWDFRAWHDWHHINYKIPFGAIGEKMAARTHVAELVALYGSKIVFTRDWHAKVCHYLAGCDDNLGPSY